MTAETTDGPPTDGAIYWSGYMAKRPYKFPYTDLDNDTRDAIEAGAAAVAAAAIARLDTPAELAAAMAENVRLRKELHERDALLKEVLDDIAHVVGGNPDYIDRDMLASYSERAEGPPALTPVEAVRIAVAEEWQPRVDALRELLDAATVDITGEVLTAAVQGKRILLQLGGGNVPQPAPELTAAMAETRELRELLGEVLRTFGDSSGDGWRSRVGQVKYRQWRKLAGLGERELIETAGTEHLAAQITEGRQA